MHCVERVSMDDGEGKGVGVGAGEDETHEKT